MQMIFDGLATQGPILVEGPLTGHLPARVLSDSFSNASPRRSEEHTSELQSPCNLVCRLLLEKKKNQRLAVPARIRFLLALNEQHRALHDAGLVVERVSIRSLRAPTRIGPAPDPVRARYSIRA